MRKKIARRTTEIQEKQQMARKFIRAIC